MPPAYRQCPMLASVWGALCREASFVEEKEAWGATYSHSLALLPILSGLNDSISCLANHIFLTEEWLNCKLQVFQ